jgi:hypothetical protein
MDNLDARCFSWGESARPAAPHQITLCNRLLQRITPHIQRVIEAKQNTAASPRTSKTEDPQGTRECGGALGFAPA